jgi:hypothetical protein
VDETQWVTSTDPEAMLEFLRMAGDPNERRCRLFACACVRRIWPLVSPVSQGAIAVAERFADGRATLAELLAAKREAGPVAAMALRGHALAAADAADYSIAHWEPSPNSLYKPGWLASFQSSRQAKNAAVKKAAADVQKSSGKALAIMRTVRDAEFHAQTILLRDIFGRRPLRAPASLDPNWLAWNDGTVRKLAEAIYEQRAFEMMMLLADALEEAGCGDLDLLGHLREKGPHVRGCWGLDLVLGKN